MTAIDHLEEVSDKPYNDYQDVEKRKCAKSDRNLIVWPDNAELLIAAVRSS